MLLTVLGVAGRKLTLDSQFMADADNLTTTFAFLHDLV
jgi:hypothetical protein